MKKLFVIIAALLFITIIYLFMSNIVIPFLIDENTIGFGGKKLSGESLTETIQLARKIILIPCIIFLMAVFEAFVGCKKSENTDNDETEKI